MRQAAVKAMQIAPDPSAADVLVDLFNKEKASRSASSVLEALAVGKSPKAAPLAVSLLKDPKADKALIPDAIAVVRRQPAARKAARPFYRWSIATPASRCWNRRSTPWAR